MNNPVSADKLISFVVPVLNEEDAVGLFFREVVAFADGRAERFEVVFVNDGSTDRTLEKLEELDRTGIGVTVVDLSRNFGKENAVTAGLEFAQGDAVVPIDVDLQDPINVVDDFIRFWNQGYEVVYGIRRERVNDTFLKRSSASLFYRVFNLISRDKIPENVGDYRLMDRKVVDAVLRLPEKNRFMKGLFSWVGFRTIGVEFERQVRSAGTTKWNFWKLWNFALDGFFAFTSLPLTIWTYIGSIIALGSFILGLKTIIEKVFFGISVQGYASMMVTILFIGGVQLISLGIIGEYIGRLFIESKNRPLYVVRSVKEIGETRPNANTSTGNENTPLDAQ